MVFHKIYVCLSWIGIYRVLLQSRLKFFPLFGSRCGLFWLPCILSHIFRNIIPIYIVQVMDININREARIFGVIPRFTFSDKGSYIESSTKEYDTLAFHYLSWALYPLLGGYAVYSLLYQEHRGWYSYVLNMLYGFLLTFGK